MEKTFTYYDVCDNEYKYTAEDYELKEAIVDELFDEYFELNTRVDFDINERQAIKKALERITNDNDNWEDLLDRYEDSLKDYFEQDAYEEYKNRG